MEYNTKHTLSQINSFDSSEKRHVTVFKEKYSPFQMHCMLTYVRMSEQRFQTTSDELSEQATGHLV